MRTRLNLGWCLVLLFASFAVGCGGGDTWLLLRLSQGVGVPAQLGSVEFQMTLTEGLPEVPMNDLAGTDLGAAAPVDLAGLAPTTKTAVVTLKNVTLPTSVSFQIAEGAGRLDFVIIARDANNLELRRETGTAQIRRGKTTEASVSIGTAIVNNDAGNDLPAGAPDLSPPADLTGVAVPDMTEGPKLQVLPANRNYGSLLVNQSTSEQTFMVTNIGGMPTGALTVTVGSTDFSVGNDLCTTVSLNPGQTCTVGAAFTPKSAGSKGAALTISNNLLATGTANLSGEGTAPGALTVTPNSHPFADTKINEMSADTATLTVTNTGGVATGVLNVTIESTSDAADFTIQNNTCLVALDAAGGTNDECTVGVRFVPKTRGDKFATIKISDGTLSAVASVNGKGLEAVLVITALGGDSDFGQLSSSCTEYGLAVLVSNTGNTPSGNLQFSQAGDTNDFTFDTAGQYCMNDNAQLYTSSYYCVQNATSYQVSTPPCPNPAMPLAGGAKCQRVVTARGCNWDPASSHSMTVTVSGSPGGTGMVTFTGSRP